MIIFLPFVYCTLCLTYALICIFVFHILKRIINHWPQKFSAVLLPSAPTFPYKSNTSNIKKKKIDFRLLIIIICNIMYCTIVKYEIKQNVYVILSYISCDIYSYNVIYNSHYTMMHTEGVRIYM